MIQVNFLVNYLINSNNRYFMMPIYLSVKNNDILFYRFNLFYFIHAIELNCYFNFKSFAKSFYRFCESFAEVSLSHANNNESKMIICVCLIMVVMLERLSPRRSRLRIRSAQFSTTRREI